ncbi:MAG: response regulator, partial [Lentisphaerae bacterium]|nr:response regulator [Lentisphaerota bacterium]
MARVLVIDDERSIRTTLGVFLRDQGYDVQTAEDAESGLAAYGRDGFDVILTDILLPRQSGVDVLEAVHAETPHVPVILMTGQPSLDTASAAVRSRAFDYLEKPVSRDTLLRVVADATAAKAREDEHERLQAENRSYQEGLARLVGERTRALQESEERFRLLLEHSFDGIVICERVLPDYRRGEILFMNRRFVEMSGLSREQLIESPNWAALNVADMPAEERDTVAESFARGEPMRGVTSWDRPDGKPNYCEWILVPLVIRGRVYSISINRDITERTQTEEAMRHHAEMDRLITEVATELVSSSQDSISSGLVRGLERIGAFVSADRSYVFQFSADGRVVSNTHEWCADGVEPEISHLQGIPLDSELPWFAGKIKAREDFVVPCVAALPSEASREKAHFQSQGIRSLVVVPMLCQDQLIGFLGFDSVRTSCDWSDEVVLLLRNTANAFAGAIVRARSEARAKASEASLKEAQRLALIGTWDVDLSTGDVTWSDELYHIMGVDPGADLKVDDLLRRLTHPDDLARTGQAFQSAIETGKLSPLEFRAIR